MCSEIEIEVVEKRIRRLGQRYSMIDRVLSSHTAFEIYSQTYGQKFENLANKRSACYKKLKFIADEMAIEHHRLNELIIMKYSII